jgi:hypothetical protein
VTSSNLHASAQIFGPMPNASKISSVVLFNPSAWPRGVGPGFVSIIRTQMLDERNQLANARLETVRTLHSHTHDGSHASLTYPAGPAPMIRTSTYDTFAGAIE